jgi:hypothetical protein
MNTIAKILMGIGIGHLLASAINESSFLHGIMGGLLIVSYVLFSLLTS